MAVQEYDEVFEAVMTLLLQMESELQREKLSLAFCDAWQEVEDLMLEIGDIDGE